MSREFDLSRHLRPDSSFRNSLREGHGLSSEQLNRAGDVMSAALEKHAKLHPGEDKLTASNFDQVMKHVRKDPRYHELHSAGETFEGALREHLGIKSAEE